MSISSAIQNAQTKVANAYTAVEGKGGTLPSTQNLSNLPTAISSIPSGGGTGITREVSAQGVYQAPTTSFTFSLPSDATDVGERAMYYAFNGCTGVTSVDLSSLTTVSGSYAMGNAFNGCTGVTSVDLSSLTTVATSGMYFAFNGCTGVTSVDLSSLTTVNGSNAMGNAFNGCTGVTSVDLSSLTTVNGSSAMGSAFNGCTGVTSVDLSNLTTVGANSSAANYGHFSQCFMRCNNLTSITFPKLEKIYCTGSSVGSNGSFANNDKVQKMYFPKLDTITYGSGANSSNRYACKNVFYGCSALTELHFAAANQAAIEASPGYSTAWGRGAGNVTIYFDL